MPLIRVPPGATTFLLQVSHHHTAIEAAVGFVDAGFACSLQERRSDSVASAFSTIEHQWVLKAIYQGAYLRTYHLWEKGCREYLASQGVEVPEFPGKFPEYVKSVLSSKFSVDVPADMKDALSTMGCKVNRIKHGSGVQNDEYVSAADYQAGALAIERFWEVLAGREQLRA